MKNNILFCAILTIFGGIYGSENPSVKEIVDPDVLVIACSGVSGSTSSISLPDSEEVMITISDISGSTVNVFIHPSNKIIHFNAHDINGSNVYLYGKNTPQIKSHVGHISGSSVDLKNIMHPARQYTYHALAGVAIVGILNYSRK